MLTKQAVNFNFSQGVQTKVDPFQLPLGSFTSLQNVVFSKQGLLQKRFGYEQLASLPNATFSYATTFNGSLTAIGSSLAAYSPGSNQWVDRGSIQPAGLAVVPLIRSNTKQTTCDAAVSDSGIACVVYTDQNPANLSQVVYKYAIADASTGQILLSPVQLSATGAPKVFILNNQFMVIYPNSSTLTFLPINISTLVAGSPVTISSVYTANSPFDAVEVNGSLYVSWAYATTPSVKVAFIDSTLLVHSAVTFSPFDATALSITADTSGSTPVLWVSFFDANTGDGYSLAVNQALTTILAPTQIITAEQVVSITSAATGGVCTFFYEVLNTYTYSPATRTDYVKKGTITDAGVVVPGSVMLRSVGLGSKAFFVNGVIYVLVAYGSVYQPTYFLSDASGNLCVKIAYANGGGYYNALLPNAVVYGDDVYISYLFKDLIVSVNKGRLAPPSAGIYSQTGVNLAKITLNSSSLNSAEIGSNLNLSGGFLWGYDGSLPVEQGFHLWPDDIFLSGDPTVGTMMAQQYYYAVTYEWTDNQGNIYRSAPSPELPITIVAAPVSFTGDRTSGSNQLVSVSSTAGLQVGQAISGAGIPAGTYIAVIGAGTVTMSQNATSGAATNTTVTPTTLTSIAVNIPTLRLTYKIDNPVKLVVYRWSVAQQTFYQTTSISSPILNDPSVDSLVFIDTNPDADILGNTILYTTGGVVENIGPPAASVVTLYKGRLFMVDAEDPNLLWFSKQVIQSTPVEMSDLFTLYVAPTISSEGSTGAVRAAAPLDDKLILFKSDAIYYITGTGPDNTGANNDFSDPIFVTSTVGCANQKSIAFIPQGLLFQSNKGIWLLGRDLSTQYIGAPVEAYNNYAVLSAVAVPDTNQVRFTLSNGVTLMYDYYYNQWATFSGIPAISSTIFNGLHTFIDSLGRVYREKPNSYIDGASPVLISFVSSWLNMAGLQGYQRAYMIYLLGTYLSPHKLTVQIAYDYNPSPLQTTIISPENYSGTYGYAPGAYGAQSPYGGSPTLEQWRIQLQKQTCQSFQISLTESFDAFFGTEAGAGFTLSGVNAVVGLKKGYRPIRAANTAG